MRWLVGLMLGLSVSLGAQPVRSVESTWAVHQSWATVGPASGVEVTASASGFLLSGLWVGVSAGTDALTTWSGQWRAFNGYGSLRTGLQMPWGRLLVAVPWVGASGPSWRALAGLDTEVRLWNGLHGVVGLAATSDSALVVSLGLRDRTSWYETQPKGPGARVSVAANGLNLRFDTSGEARTVLWSWSILAPGGQVFYQQSGQGAVPREASWTGVSLWGEALASVTPYQAVLKVTDGLGRVFESRASFTTDVMVLQEGSRSVVRIPRPRDEDPAVIGRLVSLLSNHSAGVLITGHTNLVQWLNPGRARDEQTRQALPETQQWAQALKNRLISQGIVEARLAARGEGGNLPLVSFGDEDNAWKNNRLEVSWERESAP